MSYFPIDRETLYNRVLDRYDRPFQVPLQDADSVADSVMEVVFEFLREKGLMPPEGDQP
ncbi:hypothetical protein ACFRAQ_34415 [Nocardia sp. NPDC056611]|uniref:hypothetical protein n=1 Tax=Nocardia sp. NPDC056611 TaxID=3345877 RepID=UPI00366C52CE